MAMLEASKEHLSEIETAKIRKEEAKKSLEHIQTLEEIFCRTSWIKPIQRSVNWLQKLLNPPAA